MSGWICFFLGTLFGGVVGVIAMCLCTISGEASREEERRAGRH